MPREFVELHPALVAQIQRDLGIGSEVVVCVRCPVHGDVVRLVRGASGHALTADCGGRA